MYLGIDLGTSNSAVASYHNGELRLLKSLDKGTDVLPSVIYIDRRGHKFYGHRAYEHLFKNPDCAVDGFKRQMGTSWKKEFAGSDITMNAEECSADILRQLIAQANTAHGGQTISGVVITTPAAFNQMQIEATRRAAQKSGLERIALLQEPVAAAMASVANNKNKDGLFLIYDIGGGTFDLALVQSTNGNVSIVAHEGINALGGRDFDRIIVNSIVRPWLLDNFSLPSDFQRQPKYGKMVRIMRMAAEMAKIELSAKNEAVIYLSDDDLRITDENEHDIYIEIPVSRDNYNRLIRDKLDETIELSHKILKENGYRSEDMDKLILIGGPSKTPGLRELIPHELGLPADIDTDPMTAVALGAAIFCEGIDWRNETRKPIIVRQPSGGEFNVRYDYQNRTPQDRARVRVCPQEDISGINYEIQIDSTEGWTSGRKKLEGDTTFELPLDNKGENHFRVLVFAGDGQPVSDATTEIVITRTLAGADSLKLTHNLAVVIVDDNSEKNILHVFAEKGIDLPCRGLASSYRSTKMLTEPEDSISIRFYEQPNEKNHIPGEPNLFIGTVIIRRDALTEDIQKGDKLSVMWKVSESGTIRIKVKIDKTGETIGGSFHSGHLSYEGKDGERLIADMLKSAEQEMDEIEKLSGTSALEIRKLKNTIKQQKSDAQNTADGEERRAICEKIREVRQKIAEHRNDPKNIKRTMSMEMERLVRQFQSGCYESADEETRRRFDWLSKQAKDDLNERDGNYDDVQRAIEEMRKIVYLELFKQPEFLIIYFNYLAQQRHMAMDVIRHDEITRRGEEMIESEDWDRLRVILMELGENQISGGGMPPMDGIPDERSPLEKDR